MVGVSIAPGETAGVWGQTQRAVLLALLGRATGEPHIPSVEDTVAIAPP